jgi:hypothetical protein
VRFCHLLDTGAKAGEESWTLTWNIEGIRPLVPLSTMHTESAAERSAVDAFVVCVILLLPNAVGYCARGSALAYAARNDNEFGPTLRYTAKRT